MTTSEITLLNAELKTELQNTAYDLETDQVVADYLNGLVAGRCN